MSGSNILSKLLISTDFLLEGESVAMRLGRPTDWQAWRDLRSQSRAFLAPWEPTWSADALTFNAFTHNLERQWREWKEDKGYAFLMFLKEPLTPEASTEADPNEQSPEEQPQQQPNPNLSEDKAYFNMFGRRETDLLPPVDATTKSHITLSKKLERKLGPLIGAIAITDIVRSAAQRGTLGYWIGAPFAQQGLMTEATTLVTDFAFNVLKLHRLEASCMPSNAPSLRLLARLGFEKEGLAKESLRINGRWEDHEIWGKVGG